MRVLVVGPDDTGTAELRGALRERGHEVRRTDDAELAVDLVSNFEFILLDLDLPGSDGYELCRQIRGFSMVPIVTLTASSAEVDRVIGLRLGADDCIVKPFGLREVITRIDAVARRSNGTARVVRVLTVGALVVDVRARLATVDGTSLRLTRKEFDLLVMLAENIGTVCLREEILSRVWDEHWFGPTRTLDVHIGTLRRKLGFACRIETVRGVGFRLTGAAS